MKKRRNKNLGREEWGRRAQAIVDRPVVELHSQAITPRRSATQRMHDMAHEEWMKWANVVVERLAAVLPDYVPMPMPSRRLRDADALTVEKPGRGEWMKWAQVVVDRLTTCVRVYSKPPYEDVFMSDKERQEKNGKALDLLRRIHALTDEADTPTDSLTELEHHDERVISGLKVLLRETLEYLPDLSADMQKLLKSSWLDNCNGRLADELFRGHMGYEPEGIGSGYVEHGRLPESLQNLLEREEIGQGRHPREELRATQPHNPRSQEESHRRWVERNSQVLRTAGRVE